MLVAQGVGILALIVHLYLVAGRNVFSSAWPVLRARLKCFKPLAEDKFAEAVLAVMHKVRPHVRKPDASGCS